MTFNTSTKFGSSLLLAGIIFSASIAPKTAEATIVEFQTVLGNFEVNLYDNNAPATVANFLNYVNNGDYSNSIYHRSVTNFIVQSGGFRTDLNARITSIPTNPAVTNEPVYSNVRGTIAMAKLGNDSNSATSQWFINLANNAANLDGQNGGFTVFGEVTGAGMDVIDALAALPTFAFASPFGEIPLQNYSATDFSNGVAVDNTHLIIVTAITVIDSTVDSAAGLNPPQNAAPIFSVGGSVSGLIGTVVLQINAGEILSIAFDKDFTFDNLLSGNASYVVTVSSQPNNQTCTVTNGSGLIAFSNISDVVVTCVATITDSDGDGVPDGEDDFPNDPTEWLDTDADGMGNNADPDDDNDGVPDEQDLYPLGQFEDAGPTYWTFNFIETLARADITGGCRTEFDPTTVIPTHYYCPEDSVTRAQMAVFLERGMRGSNFAPPAATGTLFSDVGAGDFAVAFIEQLSADGITAGCGSGNYCPNDNVTRAQMAVFLLRAKYGAGYRPPAATGVFADVPIGSFADGWIEALAAEGITSGCGNGNYCPEDPVTRDQMAVFLVRTFGL